MTKIKHAKSKMTVSFFSFLQVSALSVLISASPNLYSETEIELQDIPAMPDESAFEVDSLGAPSSVRSVPEERYFSYWLDGSAPGSNVLWLGMKLTNLSAWEAKIEEAKAANKKIFVNIGFLLMQSSQVPILKSGAGAQWKEFYDRVVSVNPEIFAGFYIFDEPYWNAAGKVSQNLVRENLRALAKMIKDSDSRLKTFITLATPELDNYFTSSGTVRWAFPAEIDWIGINDYTGPANVSVSRNLRLLGQMYPHQKLVFTMNGFHSPGSAPTYYDEVMKNSMNVAYGGFIRQHADRVAAIIPFALTISLKYGYGVNYMPRVKFWLDTFGQSFVSEESSALFPSGLFRQKVYEGKTSRMAVFSVGKEGYCEFESTSSLQQLVSPTFPASVAYLRAASPAVRIRNPFLGNCRAEKMSPTPLITASDVSVASTKAKTAEATVEWTELPNALNYVVSITTYPVTANCLAPNARILKAGTTKYRITGLSRNKHYQIGVCARDKDSRIMSLAGATAVVTP